MIKITISGPCHSGKTSLAFALNEFLREKGFSDVTVTDTDLDQFGLRRSRAHNDRCIEALTERQAPIVIETVQTRENAVSAHVWSGPGSCEECGDEGAEWTTDPFAHEIHGDETMHWLCRECQHNSAMEI